MIDSLGDVLPFAAGVALSPIPIIGVILMLSADRSRVTGPAFGVAWVVGLSTITVAFVAAMSAAEGEGDLTDPANAATTGIGWAKLLVGGAFLALAVHKWRTHPRDGEEPKLPAWMDNTSDISGSKAAGFGLLLSAANPKNLALVGAAAAAIVEQTGGATPAVEAIVVFVALGSLSVLIPIAASIVAPQRATVALEDLRHFMTRNNTAIMMTVLVILGLKMVGDGLKIF